MTVIMNRKVLAKHVEELLLERGVTLESIAEVVVDTQRPYIPEITVEESVEIIKSILTKREVQNTIMTGVELDKAAEQGRISDPYLAKMLVEDDGLYGMDEVINFGIVNLYGSVGFTNFGYLDKVKPGIIGKLDSNPETGTVHTFMDDIVCAIAAAACSKMAHMNRDLKES